MKKLWALADLHLSSDGSKPMHVFDEMWRNHADRMAASWDRKVAQDDDILLPGDLSWARDLESATADLEWIGARPGRKWLLKGNHDSWWKSPNKVRAVLPEGCEILHHDAHDLGEFVLLGARGWTDPDDPVAEEGDDVRFHRELERLKLSVAFADKKFGRAKPRIAMTHFPPWIQDREPSPVVPLLKGAEVRVCLYGHLHGVHHELALEGCHEGIHFQLVAADYLNFEPVQIELPQVNS